MRRPSKDGTKKRTASPLNSSTYKEERKLAFIRRGSNPDKERRAGGASVRAQPCEDESGKKKGQMDQPAMAGGGMGL